MKSARSVCLTLGSTLLSLLLLSLPAHAGLIDNGDYTSDTETHLDWLDLTLTANVSYDDIINGYGGYLDNGWSYATENQALELFKNAGATLYIGPSSANRDAALLLGELLGFNDIYERNGSKSHMSLGITSTPDFGGQAAPGFALSIDGRFDQYNHRGNIEHTWSIDRDERDSRTGSFLIRSTPVPEPSTLILFALGLAGLGARRALK